MNDEKRRIIINKIFSYRQTGSPENEATPASPASRWAAFALLIPIVAMVGVLGVFFFAIFLALFAVAAAGFGLRLWWLRRKLHKPVQAETEQYAEIEDAEIIEETKIDNKKK